MTLDAGPEAQILSVGDLREVKRDVGPISDPRDSRQVVKVFARPRDPVRAGYYAQIANGWEQSVWKDDPNTVVLTRPTRFPQPGGARVRDGYWCWTVDLADVEAVIRVETTARWRGLRVDVVRVDGELADITSTERDETPYIEKWGPEQDGRWGARVLVTSLTEVAERVRAVWP